MTPETLFMVANPLALMGWLALAIAPLAPRLIDLFAGWVLPGLLSLGYAVLMLVHFADAPGGFQTLADVQALFTDSDVALAGWVHYLAFDLFLGAWILRDARREGIAQSMYYVWSKEFLEAGKRRLAGDTARAATTDEVKGLRRESTALKEVVADQALEIRLLKKSILADGEDAE